MDPISRNMTMKKVAGFHCFERQDFLGANGSCTCLFSRRSGLGIRDFQNEMSATRRTVDSVRGP